MPVPRYRIRVAGPVGKVIVEWLLELIPVLRRAPKDVLVTVEIENAKDAGEDH